ncbi:MAG: hypothetical protein Q8Q60_02965 [Candidatus Chromulinivorax sp.]|nr:hypothetical protein [Candidatus Chromulinivorax sp.]
MKRNYLVYYAVLVMIAAGCGIQKKVKTKSPELLEQQEIIAKFADLPDAPFQVRLQKIAISPEDRDQLQAFYTVSMPQADLITFYQQQMERLGWELFAESTTRDCLMHYVKPAQLCSILISSNHLSMYVCNRKGA